MSIFQRNEIIFDDINLFTHPFIHLLVYLIILFNY